MENIIQKKQKRRLDKNNHLAYWFMGDGSSYKMKTIKGFVVVDLSTCSFGENEVNLLIERLQKLGIRKARINSNNTIKISTKKEVIKFMDMIKPHILSGFEYKIKLPN